jgi:CHAT domain-containing protein/tetratricopeptide (TPR) repeat protein
MTPTRNLRRSALGLVCLASLLALAAGVRLRDPDSKEGAALEAQPKEIAIEEKGVLAPGASREIDLGAEMGHRYGFRLEAGQFTRIVVDQRGIDVELRLGCPDGKGGSVDSPNGPQGPEILYEIAESSGEYRLDVVAEEPSAPGKYTIHMEKPVRAEEEHHQRIAAWRIFRKGERARKGDLREALARYREALPLWRQLGDRAWEGETLYRIGWMHQELREPEKAIEQLRAALPFFGDEQSRERATIRNRIGNCFLQRSELAEAKAELKEALTVARESGDATIEAGVLVSLGLVHTSLGESQKAQDFFREGVARARAAEDVIEEGTALAGLGDLLVYQGKLREAQDALERALQIKRETGDGAQVRFILRRLANIDQRLDRRDDALRRLEEALELSRRAGDHENEATILNSLGTVHLLSGDTQKAGEAYGRGLELFRELGNLHGEAFALLNLGRYHRTRGEHPAALERYGQAVEVFRQTGLRRGEVSAMYGAAQVLHDARDYRAAEQRLRSVIDLLADLRRESESQDLRASFLATKQHYHELYIDVLMHLHEEQPSAGYDVRALEANEARTARSLLELLAEPRVRGTLGQEEADLVQREQELLRNVQAAERELLAARERGEESGALASRQRDLLAELDAVQTRLRQNGSAQLDIVRPRPATLDEMRSELRGGTRLIVYALGEERSFVWCVSRTSIVSKTLPARSHLEGTARQLLRGWSQRGERSMERERRWAESLGRDLLGPIAGELGQHRLLIVGDGTLQTLPFAALPDPGAKPADDGEIPPLLMAHEVVQMQSVSVLSALRRRTKGDPPLWGAMIADPVFGGADDERLQRAAAGKSPAGVPLGEDSDLERTARNLGIEFDRLVHTGDEAAAIQELLGDEMEPFLGFDANRDKLLAEDLRKYKILHFATHGLVDPEHSEVAGLVLSLVDEKGEPREGFLLAQEIGNLDLWADLVVLSACQTGLGKEVRGEGPIGLTRSFFCAGAPRVVVSLWNVNDKATAELMKRFYRGMIKENLPPAAALRCAQISMRQGRKDWRDPYVWAPFIFQGDWDDLVQTGSGPIERMPTGTGTGPLPDDDLPGGPGSGGPRRCPDLI